MRRQSWRGAFAAIIALGGAASLVRADAVFPTAEGSTWEYSVTEQPQSDRPVAPIRVSIAGSERFSGKELLRLETYLGDVLAKTELISVDDAGVHCFRRTEVDRTPVALDPPETIIPAPLKIGATFVLDTRLAGTAIHQQSTVVAEESVEVPAGIYRAYRAHCEAPWPISVAVDCWFAPGVGMVKEIATTRGPTGRLLSRGTTELKNFSRIVPTPTPSATPTPFVMPSMTPTPRPIEIPSEPPTATVPPTPAEHESPTADETAPSPAGTATAPPSPPEVTLEVAMDRDGEPQTTFRSDVPNIFVRWSGQNLPTKAVVRVAWVAEDVGDIAPANFVVDETETTITRPDFAARFTLSRPRDGWAAGKYRVDLYVDDVLTQSVKVTIND